MSEWPSAVSSLVDELTRLPGIGRKTAQRLAFHILKRPEEEARRLARAIAEARSRIRYCSVCANMTESDPCEICSDPQRDRGTICVVEEANDLAAIERTGEYRGLYHVLGGVLAPIAGIGPDELGVKSLVTRLGGAEAKEVQEVIVATNPTVEGEATALYLAKLLKPLGVKVTRLAHGLPVGGDLEYADEVTTTRALRGRTAL